MAALTKEKERTHQEACELVALDRPLDDDEKLFILENWQESSTSRNRLDGAFFTPLGLARDVSIEVTGDRIIDLGAGIGHLSWACRDLLRRWNGQRPRELVCVERNPEYVRVGLKVLPEATWICADVFAIPSMGLAGFDCAITNPPFGHASGSGSTTTYRGHRREYQFIAVAALLARRGVAIVPQESAPFRYSGRSRYTETSTPDYERFVRDTSITLGHTCGIDTSIYRDQWRGTSPVTEIVTW